MCVCVCVGGVWVVCVGGVCVCGCVGVCVCVVCVWGEQAHALLLSAISIQVHAVHTAVLVVYLQNHRKMIPNCT